MLLDSNAVTVLCSKVKQMLLLVVAHCLLANKLLLRAGVLLTLKKLNLFNSSQKGCLGSLFIYLVIKHRANKYLLC
jgi:hypothetical protein